MRRLEALQKTGERSAAHCLQHFTTSLCFHRRGCFHKGKLVLALSCKFLTVFISSCHMSFALQVSGLNPDESSNIFQ